MRLSHSVSALHDNFIVEFQSVLQTVDRHSTAVKQAANVTCHSSMMGGMSCAKLSVSDYKHGLIHQNECSEAIEDSDFRDVSFVHCNALNPSRVLQISSSSIVRSR